MHRKIHSEIEREYQREKKKAKEGRGKKRKKINGQNNQAEQKIFMELKDGFKKMWLREFQARENGRDGK